jgi:hypothetical protein
MTRCLPAAYLGVILIRSGRLLMLGTQKKRQILAVVVILAALGVVLPYVIYLLSFVVFWFLPPNWLTQYSSQYSEERFGKVTIGMSADQVDRIMGKPLQVNYYPRNRIQWCYSKTKGGLACRGRSNERILLFSNDIVIQIESFVAQP